jgi:hypothetical protein
VGLGFAQTAVTLTTASVRPSLVGWAYCLSLAALFFAVVKVLGRGAESERGRRSQMVRLGVALVITIVFGVFTFVFGVEFVTKILGWQP